MSYTKLLRWMSRGGLFTLLVIVFVVWKAGVTSTQGPLAQKNEPSPVQNNHRTFPSQSSGPNPCSATPCAVPNLFDPESADLKSYNNKALEDAIKLALGKVKGDVHNDKDAGCSPLLVTFTIFTKPLLKEPKIYDFIVAGRRDAIWNYFSAQGLDPQKYVNLVDAPGPGKDGSGLVQYNTDRDPPVLKVTSVPHEGDMVKEGETITVTITASERYEDGHKSQPTGVQSIQVLADDGVVEPTGQYKPPLPCERKTLTVTYTVPKKHPKVIHLKVLAEDGDSIPNHSEENLEFPTDDVIPKSVMPANCKKKGHAGVTWKDGSPPMGAFDPNSPNNGMVECHFRWGICKKGYSRTHMRKNADGCQSFFDSEMANLPREEFCCDCYPECASKAPSKRKKR